MTDENSAWHILCHNVSQSILISLVQGGLFVALSMGDLICHWYDIRFSPEDLVMIIIIGGAFLMFAGFVNFLLWKYHHVKGIVDKNDDPMDFAPILGSKAIKSVVCRSERKTFQGFIHYASIKKILENLRRFDIAMYAAVVAFLCTWGYLSYNAHTNNGTVVVGDLQAAFSGSDKLTDQLNFFSFLFTFCVPTVLLVIYSVTTRDDMLRKAEDEGTDKVKDKAREEINARYQCNPMCSMSYIAILSIFFLFAGRLTFFMVFEHLGIFSSDFQTWESYLTAAAMVFAFHIWLVLHTLRRRIEWYDAIPPTNDEEETDGEAETDGEEAYTKRKDRASGIPLGHDIFYSTTQFLSAHLFGRAVFSAIVIDSAHGPQHRGVPIFVDLLTCLLFICSFFYLLYSDYLILDLMSYSDTLTAWRQSQSSTGYNAFNMMHPFMAEKPRVHGSDRPADEVGEGVETVAMHNVFTTERPSY